jgi:transposase InsO family protein
MYMAYTKNPHMPRVRRKTVNLVLLKGWSIRKASRYVGVEPSTVLRWLRKAELFNSQALIPTESSRPKRHPNELPEDIVNEIVKIRLKHNRCAEVVYQELVNKGISVSLSSVKRTLKRQGLIRKRSPWKRWHFEIERPFVFIPGDLVQIDTIHLMKDPKSRMYIYTLIDVFSRWTQAKFSERINTHKSLRFAMDSQKIFPFSFNMIQSDHGQEFSSWFTEHIRKRNIAHRHSRVRKPSDNGHLERFNRTLQEECLDRIPKTIRAIKKAVPEYVHYYNTERLHLGLKLKTPQQVLRSY